MTETEAREIVRDVTSRAQSAQGHNEEAVTRAIRAQCIANANVLKAFVTIGLIVAGPDAK